MPSSPSPSRMSDLFRPKEWKISCHAQMPARASACLVSHRDDARCQATRAQIPGDGQGRQGFPFLDSFIFFLFCNLGCLAAQAAHVELPVSTEDALLLLLVVHACTCRCQLRVTRSFAIYNVLRCFSFAYSARRRLQCFPSRCIASHV